MRNCSGHECQVPLPPELQAGPGILDDLTKAYWSQVRGAYGF